MIDLSACFIPEFCTTCTIKGTAYKCICSDLTREQKYTGYGLLEGISFFLDFIVSDLPAIPEKGERIIYNSKEYKVVKSEIDSLGQTVKVSLCSISGK